MPRKPGPGQRVQEASPPAELRRRLERVEAVMLERGWSLRVQAELVAEFRVAPRTVQGYRQRVLAFLSRDVPIEDVAARREAFLGELQRHILASASAGKWGPVAAMMNIRSRLQGLDLPQQHDVRVEIVVPEVPT